MATEVGAAAAAAVGAAIGISGTAVAIGTSLVLGATGINAKIDKAASKVFGKDLVSFANIAGSIYLAGAAGGAWDSAAGSLASAAGAAPAPLGPLGEVVDATGGIETAVGAANNTGTGVGALQQANMGLDMDPTARSGVTRPIDPNAALRPKTLGGTPGGAPGDPTSIPGKLGQTWDKLGDRGQAALLQVGGNVLGGAAQGKAAADAEKARIANENRYRSGSGLSYWQRPSYAAPKGG